MSILEPESAIWYALCWLVVMTRLASRRIHLRSWKALQLDDYLIMVAMLTDTVVMSVMHVIVTRSSNLIEPGLDVSRFTQQEIDSRIVGSKLVLLVEQMQIVTVWLVKACLLLMYYRMTLLLPQHKLVIVAAAYVAVGFIVMEILYLGVWCQPFHQYWAVPTNSKQCSAATNHLITNAVLNISSDLIIIFIPMPLLIRVKLPKKNKAILIGVFLVGTFTIVAATLNKFYSFMNPFGTEWTIWYLRESYTAILCANLPLTYPLIQRIFRLRNWSYHSHPHYSTRATPAGNLSKISALRSKRRSQRLASEPGSHGRSLRRTESEEQITSGGPLRIYQNTEFTVHTSSALEMGSLESQKTEVTVDVSEASKGRKSEGSNSDRSNASAKYYPS